MLKLLIFFGSFLLLNLNQASYTAEAEAKEDYEICAVVAHASPVHLFSNREHVRKFIGDHVDTPEYDFQEESRRNELGIKKCMEASNKEDAEKFFMNGWGQILGVLVAFQSYKISADFNGLVDQNVDLAIEKGGKKTNPFVTVNVREQAKNIMTYPHQGKYLPWQKVNIPEPISLLNTLREKYPVKFSLYDGKCYLQIGEKEEKTIFSDLWLSDFATLLHNEQYNEFKPNDTHPHITLINSNVISTIKDKFDVKYGPDSECEYEKFMDSWINEANQKLVDEINPIEFVQLDATYSEDYSPFEEVIVARLKAPCVKNALGLLVEKIRKEFEFDLLVKEEEAFHLAIATKWRTANNVTSVDLKGTVESFPDSKKSQILLKFFEEFHTK